MADLQVDPEIEVLADDSELLGEDVGMLDDAVSGHLPSQNVTLLYGPSIPIAVPTSQVDVRIVYEYQPRCSGVILSGQPLCIMAPMPAGDPFDASLRVTLPCADAWFDEGGCLVPAEYRTLEART